MSKLPFTTLYSRLSRGVLLGSVIGAGLLPAQTVRGVVSGPTGLPVPGVLVELVSREARVAARGVSDDRGAFRLSSAIPGVFRVQTRRIGFRPVLSDTISLVAGSEVQRSFVLREIPVGLDTIRVGGRSACRAVSDSATATFRVWEQVRAALSTLEATEAERSILTTVGTYQHVLSSERGGDRQSVRVRSDYVRQPWRTIPPESLHRAGYVIKSDFRATGYATNFYAPGLDMLLSSFFVEDHCFRLRRDKERLGLAFEPSSERRGIPEIRGTLWLDVATSELRRIEFQYVNVRRLEEDEGRGFVDLRRLQDGRWAITAWNIRMPLVQEIVRPGIGAEERIAEISEVGGWLALARRGNDTLWAQPPVSYSVIVADSATGAPVSGIRATVVGTSLSAVSDRSGNAHIVGILPGEYSVALTSPSDDSSATMRRVAIAVTGDQGSMRVLLRRPTELVGRLVVAATQQPIAGVEIQFTDLEKGAMSDADGVFRLRVLPGRHRVSARRIGFSPVDTTISTSAGVARIAMSRVRTLDSVVVVDRSLELRLKSFEENRRVGLGHFMTRAELAALGDLGLSIAVERTGALRLMRAKLGNQAWAISGRPAQSVYGASTRRPDEFDGKRGAPRACYAQVWVDGVVAYRGRHEEPLFDINSLRASDVEAIEVYAGASQTPLRYSDDGSSCGVLVIWTRRAGG